MTLFVFHNRITAKVPGLIVKFNRGVFVSHFWAPDSRKYHRAVVLRIFTIPFSIFMIVLATVAKEAALKDLPMFIDRDPETFAILLNYLRTSQLLVPSWADFSTLQLLKLDAHFYGIHNTAYINSLDHFNILKKFNFSINIKMTVPEIVASEIKVRIMVFLDAKTKT